MKSCLICIACSLIIFEWRLNFDLYHPNIQHGHCYIAHIPMIYEFKMLMKCQFACIYSLMININYKGCILIHNPFYFEVSSAALVCCSLLLESTGVKWHWINFSLNPNRKQIDKNETKKESILHHHSPKERVTNQLSFAHSCPWVSTTCKLKACLDLDDLFSKLAQENPK